MGLTHSVRQKSPQRVRTQEERARSEAELAERQRRLETLRTEVAASPPLPIGNLRRPQSKNRSRLLREVQHTSQSVPKNKFIDTMGLASHAVCRPKPQHHAPHQHRVDFAASHRVCRTDTHCEEVCSWQVGQSLRRGQIASARYPNVWRGSLSVERRPHSEDGMQLRRWSVATEGAHVNLRWVQRVRPPARWMQAKRAEFMTSKRCGVRNNAPCDVFDDGMTSRLANIAHQRVIFAWRQLKTINKSRSTF